MPDGWLAGQVKHATTVTLGKMLQNKGSGRDVRAPYMRAANVQPDGVLALDNVNEMWFSEAELEQLSIRAGDVVVVEGGQGGFGRAAYVENNLAGWGFQNSINRLRPIGDFDGRFIAFYLIALRASGYIRAYSNVVSMPHLTAEKLARVPIPLPPVEQQRAIANYLDRETARIDTLIEEQQRLIELLDQRRVAVIAHATTKGLIEGVPRVPSGVGWIGTVPAGWKVLALRRCGTLVTGSTPPTEDRNNFADEPNDRPWVRPQDLSAETTASAWLTPEGWSHLREVPAGSVLVGCIAYSLGSVGYLPVAATTNQQITSIIPVDGGKYLYYVMCAAKDELWASSQMNRVPILNNQRLGAIPVPVPPIEEQRLIAAYLDDQTKMIDQTKVEALRLIELARERRSALITAAVTGQIDIRETA
ncbi:restriction endonuclease subunit S [Spirillospora sp. CA-142024]|uniref:restriction endonuclease subunit S n=1 Tax=Spirillospora sp. CA-142024 TaxID=3240036 RepID=UPI003D921E9C